MKRHTANLIWGQLCGLILGSLLLVGCSDGTQLTPTPGQATLTSIPAIITTATGQNISINMELARTDKEQETGLMGRTKVPNGTGMLFVFKQAGNIAFWMKDTLLPLSIAFINSDDKILDIQDMQAMSQDLHSPNQPYQYALEVGLGWFGRENIKPGDMISFKLPA